MKAPNVVILMAEDDADDYYLTRDALEEVGFKKELRLVPNGLELLDYLMNRGKYSNRKQYPSPDLILLDLNMPIMDGRQALAEIRKCQDICHIPIVVLTTSSISEDIYQCYQMGANSYVRKPSDFESLVNAMRNLIYYWFATVELPRAVKTRNAGALIA